MHPTLFQIGSFKLPSFGAAMVVAFLLSLWLARKRAPQFGFTPDEVSDVSFWAIIAGILGARLVFIAQDIPYYSTHIKELLSPQFQGLTSFGGFIFGGIAAAIACKKRNLSPVGFLDLGAPAFLVGHAVGRLGCLLNGCCHGRPAASAFPFLAYSAENHTYNVPAQLYDSAMNVVALGAVLFITKRPRQAGFVVGLCAFLHGITRFVYEFFRAGTSSSTIGASSFTDAHVVAIVIAVIGLAVMAKTMRFKSVGEAA